MATVTRSQIDNKYNVLYFGDNVDVRLIPKNCSSTLKMMYTEINGMPFKKLEDGNPHGYFASKISSQGYRKAAVLNNGGKLFRDGSIKIAIKRDPIERWLSGVNFGILMKEFNHPSYSEFQLAWLDNDINDIAKEHEFMGINEIGEYGIAELFSQTYCGGNINQYDFVFDIKEFDKCVDLLENELGEKITRVWATVSRDKSRWKMEDLTEDSKECIRKLYAKDYDNGWF